MTTSTQARPTPNPAGVEMFEALIIAANTLTFPFVPNAPQETQEWQDPQEKQGKTLTNTRLQRSDSEKTLNLPLGAYVRQVLDFSETLNEEQCNGAWHSPVFHFARFCKAHQSIMKLPDDEALQAVESVMLSWDDLPLGSDPWKHYFAYVDDADSARIDFMYSWNSVRHIPFHDVVDQALRLAEERPVKAPHERGKLYDRFISLAGWLKVLMMGKPILLPTRKIAALLSCDQRTVSRLRKLAIQDGILTVLKEHTFRSNGKSESTEFEFIVPRSQTPRNKE